MKEEMRRGWIRKRESKNEKEAKRIRENWKKKRKCSCSILDISYFTSI
jgi:hypothetical protein